MRIIKLYRYVTTGYVPTRCIRIAPFGKFKWMKYRLFSWDKESESCVWRLDGRSVRYIPGLHIIENTKEEAEVWKT